MNNQDKINRLEAVLKDLLKYSQGEHFFSDALALLNREFRLTGGANINHPVNSYGWNLNLTIKRQLNSYQKSVKTKSKAGDPAMYQSFISAFESDVNLEMGYLKR